MAAGCGKKLITLAVAALRYADDFDGGEAATPARPIDGDGWSCLQCLDWPAIRVHPSWLVGAEQVALVELWLACREHGALPDAGGLLAQSAATMARLQIVGGVWARLDAHERETALRAAEAARRGR